MSQRRLNMKTDTLIRDKPGLDMKTFVHTSSAYGNAQEEIRQRAIAVIGLLEDDGVGGGFETQVSRLLREAVDLMYEARVLLGIAKPDSAMPYMVRVLEILDEIRLANRYYLRGVVRPEAVNVERVRLTGEGPGGQGGARAEAGAGGRAGAASRSGSSGRRRWRGVSRLRRRTRWSTCAWRRWWRRPRWRRRSRGDRAAPAGSGGGQCAGAGAARAGAGAGAAAGSGRVGG